MVEAGGLEEDQRGDLCSERGHEVSCEENAEDGVIWRQEIGCDHC